MKKTILAIAIIFAISISAHAATYYVRTDGNDACNGTVDSAGSSGNCAKRTIQAGVNLAYAGDTVIVHTGDYSNVNPTFTTARAGSSGSAITIRAASGETVSVAKYELAHAYTIGQGFRVISSGSQTGGPGVWIKASNTSVIGNTIIGTGLANTGINFYGSYSNVTIQNNILEGSNTAGTTFEVGIRVLSSGGTLITGNTIRNFNGIERGFELYGDGITVRQNTAYNWNMTLSYDDTHPDVFQIFGTANSTNVIIERNYFYNLDAQIGNLAADSGTQSWVFRNNIFANITQPLFNWHTMYWYNNLFYNCATSSNSSHVILSGGYGGMNYAYNNAFVGCGYQDAGNRGWIDVVGAQSNNFASTLSGGIKSGFTWGNNSINGGNPYFVDPDTNCVSNTCNFYIGASSIFIDTGTPIGSFSNDYAGNSRPSGSGWEIGPYELTGSGTPDTTPPVIISTSPTGTLTCVNNPQMINHSIQTDENATCKRTANGGSSGTDYDTMTVTFSTTGGLVHSETASQACNASYSYYIRCQDMSGNKMTSSTNLAYSIAAAASSPFISGTRFGSNSSATVGGTITDTYISSYDQNNNFSSAEDMYLRTYPASTAARSLILKINLSSIPSNAIINDARLYLRKIEYGGDSSIDVSVHRIINLDPTISSATWLTYNGVDSWTTAGGLGNIASAEDTTSVDSDYDWEEWSIKNMVSNWVAGTLPNYGILLTTDQGSNHATSETYRGFATSDNQDATLRPIIVIDYTVPAAAGGVLIRHPTNTRYFARAGSDDPIYLTGSHTWNLVCSDDADLADEASMTAFLDYVQSFGHNYVRLWTQRSYDNIDQIPWQLSGGDAIMDGTTWNSSYFTHLAARVAQVTARGMYASIMFFGSGVGFKDDWQGGTYWHPDNNTSSALDTAFSTTNGDTFYTSNSAALDVQKSLIRKVIDTLNHEDLIFWEVINEPNLPASATWHNTIMAYIRSYESTKPKQHLIMMSGEGADPNSQDEAYLFNSTADIVSPDNLSPYLITQGGSGNYTDKILINDTDHIAGYSNPDDAETYRKWVWLAFARGTHPIFMDPYDDTVTYNNGAINPEFDPVRSAMGQTLLYSKRMDLRYAVPDNSFSSTGYALVNQGVSYFIYQPGTGSFSYTLPNGNYNYEWYNPVTKAVTQTGTMTGGYKTSTPPAGYTDAVLFIVVQPVTPPAPTGLTIVLSSGNKSVVSGTNKTIEQY